MRKISFDKHSGIIFFFLYLTTNPHCANKQSSWAFFLIYKFTCILLLIHIKLLTHPPANDECTYSFGDIQMQLPPNPQTALERSTWSFSKKLLQLRLYFTVYPSSCHNTNTILFRLYEVSVPHPKPGKLRKLRNIELKTLSLIKYYLVGLTNRK